MMVKCEFLGGGDVNLPPDSAVADASEGEQLFFVKGAWERVVDLCQYVYQTPILPSYNESQSMTDDQLLPLTESKKAEIGMVEFHLTG